MALTTGDRTGKRTARYIFNGIHGARGTTNADKLCDAVEKVYCKYRDDLLVEFSKQCPDIHNSTIRKVITDMGIIADFMIAGKCRCSCKTSLDVLDEVSENLERQR